MATSFISERSAEYILVPKLIYILKRYFSKSIPLYFLSTREGSSISRACHPLQPVKIISVFARRPKITTPNQFSVEVKFNLSLFETAQRLMPLGIPTFAGVPLASSIFDLSLETDCAWFEIAGNNNDDIVCEVSLDNKILSTSNNSTAIEETLQENELIARVLEKCRYVEWNEAIENL